MQGVYNSKIANAVVASRETVGDVARCAGYLAGEEVTGACEVMKDLLIHQKDLESSWQHGCAPYWTKGLITLASSVGMSCSTMAREETEREVVGCCGMIIAVIKDSMLLLKISFGARAWVCWVRVLSSCFYVVSYRFNRGMIL